METTMTTHKIATREEWQAARAVLLEREKEHTRTGDDGLPHPEVLPVWRSETSGRGSGSFQCVQQCERFPDQSRLWLRADANAGV